MTCRCRCEDRVLALEAELEDVHARLDEIRAELAEHGRRLARLEAPARAAAEDLLPVVEPGVPRPDEGAC